MPNPKQIEQRKANKLARAEKESKAPKDLGKLSLREQWLAKYPNLPLLLSTRTQRIYQKNSTVAEEFKKRLKKASALIVAFENLDKKRPVQANIDVFKKLINKEKFETLNEKKITQEIIDELYVQILDKTMYLQSYLDYFKLKSYSDKEIKEINDDIEKFKSEIPVLQKSLNALRAKASYICGNNKSEQAESLFRQNANPNLRLERAREGVLFFEDAWDLSKNERGAFDEPAKLITIRSICTHYLAAGHIQKTKDYLQEFEKFGTQITDPETLLVFKEAKAEYYVVDNKFDKARELFLEIKAARGKEKLHAQYYFNEFLYAQTFMQEFDYNNSKGSADRNTQEQLLKEAEKSLSATFELIKKQDPNSFKEITSYLQDTTYIMLNKISAYYAQCIQDKGVSPEFQKEYLRQNKEIIEKQQEFILILQKKGRTELSDREPEVKNANIEAQSPIPLELVAQLSELQKTGVEAMLAAIALSETPAPEESKEEKDRKDANAERARKEVFAQEAAAEQEKLDKLQRAKDKADKAIAREYKKMAANISEDEPEEPEAEEVELEEKVPQAMPKPVLSEEERLNLSATKLYQQHKHSEALDEYIKLYELVIDTNNYRLIAIACAGMANCIIKDANADIEASSNLNAKIFAKSLKAYQRAIPICEMAVGSFNKFKSEIESRNNAPEEQILEMQKVGVRVNIALYSAQKKYDITTKKLDELIETSNNEKNIAQDSIIRKGGDSAWYRPDFDPNQLSQKALERQALEAIKKEFKDLNTKVFKTNETLSEDLQKALALSEVAPQNPRKNASAEVDSVSIKLPGDPLSEVEIAAWRKHLDIKKSQTEEKPSSDKSHQECLSNKASAGRKFG